jgi:hypothetical protein
MEAVGEYAPGDGDVASLIPRERAVLRDMILSSHEADQNADHRVEF